MHKAFEEINDINKSVDLETVDCYLNQSIAIGKDPDERSLSCIKYQSYESMSISETNNNSFDFAKMCLICSNKFSIDKNLPVKLYCGDTICKMCLLPKIKQHTDTNFSLNCIICNELFIAKLNKQGFIVVNKKYSRIRDSQGNDLRVINQIISPEMILKQFPTN